MKSWWRSTKAIKGTARRVGLLFAVFIALAGCSAAPGEPGENNTLCGNGVREPGEQCEGADLGGQTCEGLSLGSGTLACTGCVFDTSGCSGCGNGVCDPTESREDCPADCGVRLLAAGEFHACAAMGDGTMWCWGRNSHGTLGNGTFDPSPVPVLVPGVDDVVDLCAAMLQTCVLLTDGTVWCWGGVQRDGALGGWHGEPEPCTRPGQRRERWSQHLLWCRAHLHPDDRWNRALLGIKWGRTAWRRKHGAEEPYPRARHLPG